MISDKKKFLKLEREIIACKLCPRLVNWRIKTAEEKTKRYRSCEYWGKAVPGFGDINARVLIVGLAPAAHGGNRTGRMFTGDRSGDFLYRALKKYGFANQATSISNGDGLKLRDCYITASARCTPPSNILAKEELMNCRQYLLREIQMLMNVRVIIALGKIAFKTVVESFEELNLMEETKRMIFKHGKEYQMNKNYVLITSFHPSQRNTFTGKLTEKMFDNVFRETRNILG